MKIIQNKFHHLIFLLNLDKYLFFNYFTHRNCNFSL